MNSLHKWPSHANSVLYSCSMLSWLTKHLAKANCKCFISYEEELLCCCSV